MTDLVEALESIAERGTPRGAGAVFAAARRDVARSTRGHRHRGLIAAGLLVLAGLGVAAGVVATRDDDGPRGRVATTPGTTAPGPGTVVSSGALSDPTVTCVVERDGRRATGSIDPTVVPSSVTIELDGTYRAVVSVVAGGPLDVTAPTAGREQRTLRVDLYGPPGERQLDVLLRDGVIARSETDADPSHPIMLGAGVAGTTVWCSDARARLVEASKDLMGGLPSQTLALDGTVRTPAGWVRTTDLSGGSSATTTFTDPANRVHRFDVHIDRSVGSGDEVDGGPGSIPQLVPADARATLVQFGPRTWRYERRSSDSERITVGAWAVLVDPTTKQASIQLHGEITVPEAQRPLADAVILSLIMDAELQNASAAAAPSTSPALEFPASLTACDGEDLEYLGNGLSLLRFFNRGATCGLAGVPRLRGLDESGTWRTLPVVPLLMAPTNGPKWTGAFSPDLVAVVSIRDSKQGYCAPSTAIRYRAIELTMGQGTVITVDVAFDDVGCGFEVTPFSADSQDR